MFLHQTLQCLLIVHAGSTGPHLNNNLTTLPLKIILLLSNTIRYLAIKSSKLFPV